jgi:hypothetical protein
MTYKYATLDEMKARADWFITKPADIPGFLHQHIHNPPEGVVTKSDVLTPFLKGKEWLYEETAQFQPRTGKLLLEGSQLYIIIRKVYDTPEGMVAKDEAQVRGTIVYLIQEVNGMVVHIPRQFLGSNISDPTWKPSKWQDGTPAPQRQQSFCIELTKAYYTKFDGLSIPSTSAIGIESRLLPLKSNGGWESVNRYLEQLRLKKKHISLIEEFIPDIKPKRKYDNHTNFMSFLDTRPLGDEVFFVKNHIQDGVIYCLKKGDVPNMQILNNPIEAIDLYCEHILLRREGKFDFTPFLTPFRG